MLIANRVLGAQLRLHGCDNSIILMSPGVNAKGLRRKSFFFCYISFWHHFCAKLFFLFFGFCSVLRRFLLCFSSLPFFHWHLKMPKKEHNNNKTEMLLHTNLAKKTIPPKRIRKPQALHRLYSDKTKTKIQITKTTEITKNQRKK